MKEKYCDCLYGEDALLLGKVKWVQHKIVSIPSKHALSSLPELGAGAERCGLPGRRELFLLL